MAITFVNGTGVCTLVGASAAFSYSPTAGNYVVIGVDGGSGATYTTCTDNNGHALSLITNLSVGSNSVYLFAGVATAGATGYTAHSSNASFAFGVLMEYSGPTGFGANNTNSGTSTLGTISITSTGANSWVVAPIFTGTNRTFTSATGNLRETNTNNGGVGVDNTAVSSGTSITCSININLSTAWVACAVELLAPAPASAGPTLMMSGMGF